MTFNIVAMICIAGMSPADCGPEPGFSRDKVIIGKVSNEIECLRQSEQDVGKSQHLPKPRGRRVHQDHVCPERLIAVHGLPPTPLRLPGQSAPNP